MRRLLFLVATVAMVLSAVMPAAAHSPDPVIGDPMTQGGTLQYRWAAAGTPPYDMKIAIHSARNDANDAAAKAEIAEFDYDVAGGNVIYYGTDVPCGVNGLACFRRDPPSWFGMWFRENGHRFDWGTLRWCELTGAPDGCFDAENVALDELGHVLGLDHHVNYADDSDYKDAVVQTYTRSKPKSGYNAHAFGRCDIATLQQQYDVPTFSTLYSTCLDLPTFLTLGASSTSVVSGSMVTFTATLRTDGTGRLSNNPMNGRKVVLQQRTSSGWSDVSTMASGSSGTYTTSLTLRASQDYRALFRAPSAEGVQADGSSAVSISVTAACTAALCPQVVNATQ